MYIYIYIYNMCIRVWVGVVVNRQTYLQKDR